MIEVSQHLLRLQLSIGNLQILDFELSLCKDLPDGFRKNWQKDGFFSFDVKPFYVGGFMTVLWYRGVGNAM